MRRRFRITLYLFFLGLGCATQAQTPLFESFNLGEGKRTVRVQAFAQDQSNHMYLGTESGLYFHDGLNFTHISIHDSLSKVNITALAMRGDDLWIGTTTGDVYVGNTKGFRRFDAPEYLGSTRINDIEINGDAVGLATYGDGVYLVEGTQVRHLNVENGLGDDYTYDLCWHDDRLWIGTDAGISQVNMDDFSIGVHSMRDGLPDNIVRKLCHMNDSVLVIGMYDMGIAFLNTRTMAYSYLDAKSNSWVHGPVEGIVCDHRRSLWVGTREHGLIRVDWKGRQPFVRAYSEVNELGSNRISTLFEDAEFNIWIGTQKGVSLYTGSTFEFLGKNEGLPGINTYDILVDRAGVTWLATDGGVYQFKYSRDGEGLVVPVMENSGAELSQVVTLLEDRSGAVWMGAYGGGLFRYDARDRAPLQHFDRSNGLPNMNILDLAQDARGRIWMATSGGGLVYATEEGGRWRFSEMQDPVNLRSNYLYCLYLDEQDWLWIGSDGAGVSVYDCEADVFKPLIEADHALNDMTVYSIAERNAGEMWMATADHGLYMFNKGKWAHFGLDEGLKSTAVVAIKTVGENVLAAAHPLGIDLIYPHDNHVSSFAVTRTGFDFEPNLNAIHADGYNLWIGTESGAVKFGLQYTGEDAVTPKVSLTNLRVLYEEQPFDQEASFGYQQNHFVFDYQAVWMRAPEKIRYKYMLEGFDKQWSFETESRIATYSSLPPGKYTFRVIATSGDGRWSDEADASYSFQITRPFWMQWWFYLVMGLVLAIGIRAFIRYRTKRLILEKKRLEEKVNQRTQEIRKQKEIIEHKTDEILSSITYAKRIQTAILPPDRLVQDSLPEAFVLYKPKDIVAGDFYWMEVIQPLELLEDELDEEIRQAIDPASVHPVTLFAAADCTGHGVPGAMVSVVCHGALNRAVREYGLLQPSEILNKVLELVVEQFQRSEEDVKDGMDIALCSLRRCEDGAYELEYSGAQNPLWLATSRPLSADQWQGEEPMTGDGFHLYEIKANKQPIGKYAVHAPFTNYKLRLQKGDTLYVFTDGYADQFGGDRGKKFKYKPLKQLLLSIQHMRLEDQKERLDAHFEEWRGELEQVDDVCMIGVRMD